MKKSSITIPFEDEKLQALRLFSGKKNADIDSELEDALQKLYEKYVPKDARELVEMMAGGDTAAKPRAKKATPPRPPADKIDTGKAPQPATGAASDPSAAAHTGGGKGGE